MASDKPNRPKKAKDPARPTRAKAARPELPPIAPALADLLNPAINRGEAGVGSQTGQQDVKSGLQPPADNSRDRRTDFAAAHRARASTPERLQGAAAVRLCGEIARPARSIPISPGRSASSMTTTDDDEAGEESDRAAAHARAAARPPDAGRGQRERGRRHRPGARSAAARGPAGVPRPALDAAPPAASGKIRRRPAARHQVRLRAEGRPAAGDRRAGRGRQPPRPHPGAARRHRLGQDLHHGEGDRGDPAPGADPRAQQDAGGPALRRVQELLSRQRGRVFRLLLRLLPARSLRPAHRHLYREGILDQRADRPHAPLGDARAARARRRHHRRLGVVHLRHRLGRDLYGDDLRAQARRAHRPAPADRRPRRAAVQAHARRLLARHLPGARRHHRHLPGPLRGPRLAREPVRRRGRDRSTSSIRSPGTRPTS